MKREHASRHDDDAEGRIDAGQQEESVVGPEIADRELLQSVGVRSMAKEPTANPGAVWRPVTASTSPPTPTTQPADARPMSAPTAVFGPPPRTMVRIRSMSQVRGGHLPGCPRPRSPGQQVRRCAARDRKQTPIRPARRYEPSNVTRPVGAPRPPRTPWPSPSRRLHGASARQLRGAIR
jgi:hypothetical protein